MNTSDGYEGDWVGIDPEAKDEEVIDLNGKLRVGITGSAGLGFDCMALLLGITERHFGAGSTDLLQFEEHHVHAG